MAYLLSKNSKVLSLSIQNIIYNSKQQIFKQKKCKPSGVMSVSALLFLQMCFIYHKVDHMIFELNIYRPPLNIQPFYGLSNLSVLIKLISVYCFNNRSKNKNYQNGISTTCTINSQYLDSLI